MVMSLGDARGGVAVVDDVANERAIPMLRRCTARADAGTRLKSGGRSEQSMDRAEPA